MNHSLPRAAELPATSGRSRAAVVLLLVAGWAVMWFLMREPGGGGERESSAPEQPIGPLDELPSPPRLLGPALIAASDGGDGDALAGLPPPNELGGEIDAAVRDGLREAAAGLRQLGEGEDAAPELPVPVFSKRRLRIEERERRRSASRERHAAKAKSADSTTGPAGGTALSGDQPALRLHDAQPVKFAMVGSLKRFVVVLDGSSEASVQLRYRSGAGNWKALPMKAQGGVWVAALPIQAKHRGPLEYYYEAQVPGLPASLTTLGSAVEPYTVLVR